MFEVIPALDIRAGRCVRLYQGDYSQETVFGDDPLAVARGWQEAGATRLHVVDLDGARSGQSVHRPLLERLVAEVAIPVQVGGGLRQSADLAALLAAGAARVVLGTAALKDPALVEACLSAWGAERLVVALDARAGRVATEGWLEQSEVSALELALHLGRLGVQRILYTDISRDGTLGGPNVEAVRQMVEASGLAVIASGGVSQPEHVAALKRSGAESVVVGRALYSGALTFQAAREAAATARAH
ncbi:MAG: 1-(5-phosphoribosyl)-5-[(5-phosphoribosylamino)methylideneamino]imidazole-4-carboxamide isomerase [Chloroflexi bacterium]|nr:1-(5-phosphoribosyl)-5-[(5-phosphoribosylamino)methylideneamino]imidazole-4-carboxamide isomerase [Chloroflexota bacterium]